MAQEAAAEATTEQATAGEPDAFAALVGSVISTEQIEEAEERAADEPARPAAAGAPGSAATQLDDPLDETLFSDDKLATPDALRAARETLKAERAKANQLRQKAQNAHAAAESREAKFKRTKEQVLADKQNVLATQQMMGAHIAALRSGDPDKFLQAVGALSGSPDPVKFWREASIKLATGGKGAPGEADTALLARIDQLEQTIQAERAERANRNADAEIAAARREQTAFAQQHAETPFVQRFAQKNPGAVDNALFAVKQAEYQRTGRPVDTATACGILERELQAQLELLQPGDDPNGDPTAKRGDAAHGAVPGQVTGAVAKPGPAQRPPASPQPPNTIPPSLSAEPGAARRSLSPSERRAADVKALDDAGFFKQFGM